MRRRIRPCPTFVLACLLALSSAACVTQKVKRVNEVPAQVADKDVPQAELLDVVVTPFAPGIPKTAEEQKKENVNPSVRQAEANYFPQVLRQALDGTGYWGTVRVMPQATPGAHVVVGGEILHSDGEKLKLKITASDATGRKWFDRVYEETAAEIAYTGQPPPATDPFQDLYNRVANDLLTERRKLQAAQLTQIRRVAELKFEADLAPARFNEYLKKDKDGLYSVDRLPPTDDPYVARIAQIRQRDDMLVDTLDGRYSAFRQEMQPAYQEWRKQNYQETVALRELESQATWRKVLGAAAVIGGIVAMSQAKSAGVATVGELGIFGGIIGFQSGMSKSKEAEVHAEAIKELNTSIESDVQPRVVELEGKTVTLTGSAKEQYDQWRKLLHERYAAETGTAGAGS